MRTPRVFTRQTLALSATVTLEPSASQHLAKVLRMQAGDRVALFDGEGKEFEGAISVATKSAVEISLDKELNRDCESPLDITLLQGVSRGERMDYTIQKAVELGVTAIRPLFTERTVVRLKGERLAKREAHWQAVIESACEQCGRNRMPKLLPALSFDAYLDQRDAATDVVGYVLNPLAEIALSKTPKQQNIELLIGPEGGLNDSEINQAVANGFSSVLLGPRILRTETAGVVALSVLQAIHGDL